LKTNNHIASFTSINELLVFINNQYNQFVYLDSNNYSDKYGEFDKLLAFGKAQDLKVEHHHVFGPLKAIQLSSELPIFSLLSYDLKNEIEQLSSLNYDVCACPELVAFEPLHMLVLKDGKTTYTHHSAVEPLEYCKHISLENLIYEISTHTQKHHFYSGTSLTEYLIHFESIKNHIQRGDIYEINYCLQYKALNIKIDPVSTFCNLQLDSPAPFGAIMKFDDIYLISSSPERYLKKKGNKLISQPIKGTSKRFLNEEEDKNSALELRDDAKEQNENVMIVDLVRNDLSKVATKASVHVEELFGIYSFAKVHQMISTVNAELKHGFDIIDVIKSSFPMGSMTGAPKISAMKIIDEHEDFKRSFYSGSIAYITPHGDFDSSVIIRSLIYNSTLNTASIGAGSAITAMAEGEKEYKECGLKAEAIINSIVTYVS